MGDSSGKFMKGHYVSMLSRLPARLRQRVRRSLASLVTTGFAATALLTSVPSVDSLKPDLPSAEVLPLERLEPDYIQRFREQFGLSTAPADVLASARDKHPESITRYGLPLSPAEFEDLTARADRTDASHPLRDVLDRHRAFTGDVWIDQQQGGQFVVMALPGLDGSARAEITSALPSGASVRFEAAQYPAATLEEWSQALTPSLMAFTAAVRENDRSGVEDSVWTRLYDGFGLQGTTVAPSIQRNRVEIGFVQQPSDSRALASVWETASRDGLAPPLSAVVFRTTGRQVDEATRKNNPGQVKAGLALHRNPEAAPQGDCTSNLSVVTQQGIYMLGSGHCLSDLGYAVYHNNQHLGNIAYPRDSGPADVSAVRLNPGGLASEYAYARVTVPGYGYSVDDMTRITSFRPNALMYVGDQACMGGLTTDAVRCGQIEILSEQFGNNYSQVRVKGITHGPGDSGALWASGSVALGIHIGGYEGTDRADFSTMENALNHLRLTTNEGTFSLITSTGETSPSSWMLLRSRHSLLCIDVPNGSTQNGLQVQQYGCNASVAQRFHLTPSIVQGEVVYQIRRADPSNKCLDVDGWSHNNGARVIQWDCHSGNNQKWRLVRPNDTGWGTNPDLFTKSDDFWLMSVESNKCLDVTVWSQTPIGLQQWDCGPYGQANQLWHVA
jgi:hypothetical protein